MRPIDYEAARAPRKRWRRWLLLTPLTVLLVLIAVVAAITCRPSWYEPRSIDYTVLEADKRAQLRMENQISAALNQRRPIALELSEDQVNRWIAAREELWPGRVPTMEPLHRPMVRFLDQNRVGLAAEAQRASVRVVVSLTLTLTLTNDSVEIAWSAARAGALPLPRGYLDQIGKAVEALLDSREIERQQGRLVLPSAGVWPNGKQRFRLTELIVESGLLRARLEPVQ